MGTSYVKTAGRPEMKKIPLDPVNPWAYAEDLYQDFGDLLKRVTELENELWDLQKKIPTTLAQPPSTKKFLTAAANMSTQTEQMFSAEKMEIETTKRRWIKCSSLKKKNYYTKVYTVKRAAKEEMEVEGEIKKKTRKSQKPRAIKSQLKVRWYKTYIKKEMMAIEESKETEAVSKSPPRKRNPGVKTKSKGTPVPLKKKRVKKNTPKKVLGGSELKFNAVKLDSQPMKITLMTDFFSCMPKYAYIPSIKKPPDPGLVWLKGQSNEVDKTDP
jgi:hypothetical protein